MATETFELIFVSKGDKVVQRNIRNIGTTARSTINVLGLLRAALVVVASIRVAKGLTDLADSFTNISNRLKLVTNNTEELSAVQEELFRISQATRSSFEANATVFFRLARSTLNLNLTFQELLDISKGLGQAIAIAGAQSQEAKNALIQFSQGLAAGAVTGDELRSVSEQLPPIADAIGAEFGISGGELIAFAKAAGNDRILGLEKVIRGLQKALGGFNTQFMDLSPTIEQAFVVFNNALIQFAGNLEKSTGIAGQFAKAIIFLANNLDTVVEAVFAVATGFAALFTTQLIAKIARAAVNILLLRDGLLATAKAFLAVGIFGFVAGLTALRNETIELQGETVNLSNLYPELGKVGKAALLEIVGVFVDEYNPALEDGRTVTEKFADLSGKALIKISRDILPSLIGKFIEWIEIVKSLADVGPIFRSVGEKIKRDLLSPLVDVINFFDDQLAKVGIGKGAKGIVFVDEEAIKEGEAAAFRMIENLADAERKGAAVQKRLEDGVNVALKEAARLSRSEQFIDPFDDVPLTDPLSATPKGERSGGAFDAAAAAVAKLEKALRSLEDSISPRLAAQSELAEAQKTINDATAKGIALRIPEAEILDRVRRETVGVGNAQVFAVEKLQLLDTALQDNVINLEEHRVASRATRIEALEASRTLEAGLAFLNLQESVENVAKASDELLTTAFQGAEDALVKFVNTGRLSVSDLANDIQQLLLRGAIKALIAQLGGALTGTGGGAGAGGLLGSLATSLFGGGGINAAQGGSFAGSLFGAQNGANFTVGAGTSVGSLPGTDNRLVAFRARDGEDVSVTPKNQSKGAARPINVTINVSAPSGDPQRIGDSVGQAISQAATLVRRFDGRNN
jgi:lambda family phage tail tape measure protein